MNKAKTIFNYVLGVLLVPIFLAIFIVDRFVLLPIIWLPIKTLGKWYGDGLEMWLSILRVTVVFILVMIYFFILTFV
jgi:hypothetical protein